MINRRVRLLGWRRRTYGMIADVVLRRRLLVLLVVPLVASCTKPWRDNSGLPPTATPSVPAAAPTPTSAGPTAPAAVEAASACALIGAQITVGDGGAASGYRELALKIRNCGNKPYEVKGRPDIVVLDEDGHPLKVAVVASVHYTEPARRLVLKPGEGATTMLSWRNTVTDVDGGSDTGTSLAVAVAPGKPRQIVTMQEHPLDLGNTRRLEASAWF
ncbi:DUF4232 domain-containing protein [Actinoplanes solisilvae]|uniref:DUF4232 domain-containing protein n=1 Tax=Actinoplanes solisilvae TaxID=2486853 RepID=UPI000FD8795C|nr:DUF4232 domain-containing protein [Actinoplanes solisilvae]